jgi:hypothetical protein
MLGAVVEHFLDHVSEREFDAPFIALLLKLGFRDVHYLHGQYEFGKDFIARATDGGQQVQYVFQSKAGDLSLGDWSKGTPQLDLLRTNTLAHPGFDAALQRKAVLVLTGRLTGGAGLAAQNYCDRARDAGIALDIWDRESLVERIVRALDVGVAGRAEGPLFALIGAIDDGSITEVQIERFSRRWISPDVDEWACALEAAIVAERLANTDRPDLASYAALGILRAAWARHHGETPPKSGAVGLSDVGRLMFRGYAAVFWQRGKPGLPDPDTFVRAHDEPSGYLTYPVRCMRYVEILSLLDLMPDFIGAEVLPDRGDLSSHIAEVIRTHPGCAHPISDRWAVSLLPLALVLLRAARKEQLSEYLIALTKWIADRYERDHIGLASAMAEPIEEAEHILGRGFPENHRRSRRSESYVSAIVLDLAALCGMADVYKTARNEYLAVGAFACVVESDDRLSQYRADDTSLRFEPNVPYRDELSDNLTDTAPHYARQLKERYLERIGRPWDLLAVSAFLRDRHFLSVVHSFAVSSRTS